MSLSVSAYAYEIFGYHQSLKQTNVYFTDDWVMRMTYYACNNLELLVLTISWLTYLKNALLSKNT